MVASTDQPEKTVEQSRWDDLLIAEHELIERVMAVLRTELEHLTEGELDVVRLERALDFLLEFGDKMHNTKEERELFPLMADRGLPVQGGPIGVMLAEHVAERALLQQMLERLPGLAEAPADDRAQMQSEGLAYLQVRADHIWKENDVLYMMGRRIFDDADNDKLVAAFAQIDAEHYGEGARERFGALVEEIEGGAGRVQLIRNLSYDQIDAMLEALPVEVSFVDANDAVAYFSRLDREKIFPRTRSAIGRKVEKCHPEHSVSLVLEIVEAFKAGTRDKAEFWIDFKGDKVLIEYFAVRDQQGEYLGVMEVTQNIKRMQKMQGEKVLLDG